MAYDCDGFSFDICWYCFGGKSFGNSGGEVMQEMKCLGLSIRVIKNKRALFVYRRIYGVNKWLVFRADYLVQEEPEAGLFLGGGLSCIHL